MRALGYGSGIDYSFFFNGFNNRSSSLFGNMPLNKLNMINSGAYKKMLVSYMQAKKVVKGEIKDIKQPKDTTEIKALSKIKSNSSKLAEAANKLSNINFSDRDAALGAVKEFVSSYNGVINSIDNVDNTSVLRRIANMTGNINASSKMLKRIGINIEKGNTLSINEEDFKKASEIDLESVLKGRNSIADKIASNSQVVENISSNKINSVNGTYGHTGSYYKSSLATKVDVAV